LTLNRVSEQTILKIRNCEPFLWKNPGKGNTAEVLSSLELKYEDILDAERRWRRFAPLISRLFGEPADGLIESPLLKAERLKHHLEKEFSVSIGGRLFIKCDNRLSIAGSIKARGGIYEVLKFAETLLICSGLLTTEDNYTSIAEERCRRFLSEYTIAVGSTGNLGLSVGTAAAALGFRTTVHMSLDAKQWKKQLLRSRGAVVIEHASDYSDAIREGRAQAIADPKTHFVDDENSADLFLGYSVAALRIRDQISRLTGNDWRRIFVYLPCGVGGAPGGITFGMKHIYGDSVISFFAEPTHAPCFLLGLVSQKHEGISAKDIGIDGKTIADGLAVTRPSALVCRTMDRLVDGAYTVDDACLLPLLSAARDYTGEKIEPSAAAALVGPAFAAREGLCEERDIHIGWLTGGSMIPGDTYEKLYEEGKGLLR